MTEKQPEETPKRLPVQGAIPLEFKPGHMVRTDRPNVALEKENKELKEKVRILSLQLRAPLGIKNKNPLNMKNSSKNNPWKGSDHTDSRGHCIFIEPAYSYRAMIRTMQNQHRRGRCSIHELIETTAPASDPQGSIPGKPHNEPNKFAKFVADKVGVEPLAALKLFDMGTMRVDKDAHELLIDILYNMAVYENGHDFTDLLDKQDIAAGIKLFNSAFGSS